MTKNSRNKWLFNVKKSRLGENMTEDPKNIKDDCKEKGNNPLSFIADRTEVTCRLRKAKRYFLIVRKVRP